MSRLPHRLQDSFGPLTRRQMLKGSTLAAIAATLPAALPGCDSGHDSSDEATDVPLPAEARETRTLHFDFSLSQSQVKEARLIALRSAAHGAPLRAHTDASRRRHRAQRPALGAIPDAQLTHYIEDVDLPADALQLITVVGTHADTGEPMLCGMHVHIPRPTLATLARQAATPGAPSLMAAKRQAYNLRQGLEQDAEALADFNSFASPLDAAVALVFHHPEIVNLNVDQGAAILHAIQSLPCHDGDATCRPFLDTLTFEIATRWPATTTPGGWATLVPIRDKAGKPVLSSTGTQLYSYELHDEVAAAAAKVARDILKGFIFDNPAFAGSNWHPTQGVTAVAQPQTSSSALATAEAEPFQVAGDQPTGGSVFGNVHGLDFVSLEVIDAATRQVRLEVKNHYFRFISAYVQFFPPGADTSDDTQALEVSHPNEEDTKRSKFLAHITTNDNVLGIPLTGDNVHTNVLEFVVPSGADHAKVLFGSLGRGGNPFCPEALTGAILTCVFNIGIPSIFLAIGIGVSLHEIVSEVFTDAVGRKIIIDAIKGALIASLPDLAQGIYVSGSATDVIPFLTGLGTLLLHALLEAVPWLGAILAAVIGLALAKEAILDAFPFVGGVLKLAILLFDVAVISQSVGEVIACPALFANTISLTMDTRVTIKKDPHDFHFPARATYYRVVAIYNNGRVTRTAPAQDADNTIDPTAPYKPIEVLLAGVPSGGEVTVEVILLAEDRQTLVGYGSVGPIANLPATAGEIDLEIEELLIPLTAKTKYNHHLKLVYQNGQRVWAEEAPPEETVADLKPGQDNTLLSLNSITVHTPTGMAGYGFEAGGMAACSGRSGAFHTVQNVSLDQKPKAFKALGCGYATPVGIVYDAQEPATVGRHFFLQPTSDGQWFDLRSVTLDDTTPFNLKQTQSWGRFTQALDSLAVHPSGRVVGVNRQNHKMEILDLPSKPVNDAVAPHSVPFAVLKSGEGARAGLMHTPVAVAVSRYGVSAGAILVLEQGNRRVQAFDTSANPNKVFKKQTTNLMPLRPEGAGVVYLDLGVDATGYLFVLSYVNNGLAASDYRLISTTRRAPSWPARRRWRPPAWRWMRSATSTP